MSSQEVEHWMGPGGNLPYLPQPNSECLLNAAREAVAVC